MGILDQIARGTTTSPMDIAKAGSQGRGDAMTLQGTQQELQIQSLKMNEWLNERDRKSRTRKSQEGQSYSTSKETAIAAESALDTGDYQTAIRLQTLSDSQKTKKGESFGDIEEIYSNGKLIGYGQRNKKSNKIRKFIEISNKRPKKSELPSTPLQPIKAVHSLTAQRILSDPQLRGILGDDPKDTDVSGLTTDVTLAAQGLVDKRNNAILSDPTLPPMSYDLAIEQSLYRIKMERIGDDKEYMNKEQAADSKKQWLSNSILRLKFKSKYKDYSDKELRDMLEPLYYDTKTRELFR